MVFSTAAEFHRLLLLDVAFGDDLRRGDVQFADLLLGDDLGLLGFPFALRFLAHDQRRLLGGAHLDLALLVEPGELLVARDLELLLLGVEVLALDQDLRLLLDVVADLAPFLDRLGELGQALRVEGVLRVEVLAVGLVEPGQRHRFELEPVLEDVLGDRRLHLLDEVDALLVKFFHRHLGGDGAERIDELALDQVLEVFGIDRPPPEGLRRVGDRFLGRLHADIELDLGIDPHPVPGDERLLVGAMHLQAEGVHVDRHDLMQHREDQRTTVHDHALTAEAGAHERHFLRGPGVEPGEDHPDRQQAKEDGAREEEHVDQAVRHPILQRLGPPIRHCGIGVGDDAIGAAALVNNEHLGAL